jgi:hypothetical protein
MKKLSAGIFFFLPVLFFSCGNPKEIPFESTGNRIIVNATINGKSGRFFWDTGTSISQFDCNFSNLDFSRRLPLGWAFFGVREELDSYYLPEITIGRVRLKTRTEIAEVSDALNDNIIEPEGLDGVLGIGVFAGYWCEVSFSKEKIILHKEKPPRFEKLIPVSLYRNQFRVSVDADGKGAPFMIDTGDPGGIRFPPSIILGKTKDEYEKVLVPPNRDAVPVRSRDVYLVKTNRIALFDDVFENETIITNSPIRYDANMATTMGNLGIEFLKGYDLLFDFTNLPSSASGLYYKRIDTEGDKEFFLSDNALKRVLETGIHSFYRVPEGVTLGIIKGSVLNTEYGITEKTVITRIDGKPVQEISNTDMWNMDIAGVKNFTVLENGNERTLEFKLGSR